MFGPEDSNTDKKENANNTKIFNKNANRKAQHKQKGKTQIKK